MNTADPRYDFTTRLLHWLSAVIIIWASCSGLYVSLAEVSQAMEHLISYLNVSVTTLFIPFFCWRLLHRLATPHPPWSFQMPPLYQLLTRAAHWLLYLLTALVLLSGVLMMEHEINVFSLFTLPQPLQNTELNQLFRSAHSIASRCLAVVVLLHIAAVIKHELAGRNILRRML